MLILEFERIAVKLTPTLEKALKEAKAKQKRYQSEIVRSALKEFFKSPPNPRLIPYALSEKPGNLEIERCFTITTDLLAKIDNYILNSGYPPLTRSDIIRYALQKYLFK
jgi:metal-responsive CopG/Arc/MetJ family transcriptional regulator